MNSKKRCCNCCFDNENNKRRRSLNIEPRAVIDKENIIQQKRSCGCGCARKSSTEIKSNLRCCQPRRNSENVSQQMKATVSGVDKVKVATRVPLGELKVKSANIQCCSTNKNCCGAVKKVTNTNAPFAVSTAKKNPTRSSAGVATSTLLCNIFEEQQYFENSTGETEMNDSYDYAVSTAKTNPTRSSTEVATSTQSCYIFEEQQYFDIPTGETEMDDSYDYANVSSNSDLLFHSPHDSVETWLTFKTNRLDVLSLQQSPCKREKSNDVASVEKLKSNNEPIQIIYDGIPCLRKKTLKKQLNFFSGYKGIVNLDPNTNTVPLHILYSTYIIDIIKNIIAKERILTIDKNLMKFSNIHPIYRTAVINWLIKLQVYLNSDSSVFYICIRLFDKLLANTEIPQDLLQLTGMITYWIANKYDNSLGHLTVNQLEEICNYRYSAGNIINYERKILTLLNYDVSVEEPIIFVRYYIYLLRIDDSNDMSFCANYLLDCLANSCDINTFPLSLQACAAVYLSLQFLGNTLNIWKKLESYPGFYDHEDLYDVNNKIIEQLLSIQNENYEFREVFIKYANEKYNNISVRVYEGLKNLK